MIFNGLTNIMVKTGGFLGCMGVSLVIPARYASSRFPGKPLALIQGVSLLERTYRRAASCKQAKTCLIATDDARIASHARSFGADVVMTSPTCPSGTDRIAEVLSRCAPTSRRPP